MSPAAALDPPSARVRLRGGIDARACDGTVEYSWLQKRKSSQEVEGYSLSPQNHIRIRLGAAPGAGATDTILSRKLRVCGPTFVRFPPLPAAGGVQSCFILDTSSEFHTKWPSGVKEAMGVIGLDLLDWSGTSSPREVLRLTAAATWPQLIPPWREPFVRIAASATLLATPHVTLG